MRTFLFIVLLAGLSSAYAQVEIPLTESVECTIMQKNNFSYCLNKETYTAQWTALRISAEEIETHQPLPSDLQFFPGIKQYANLVWPKLENQVKLWALEFDSVYVVSGKVPQTSDTSISNAEIYFKAILKGCQGDAIGFLINMNDSGTLSSFSLTIDSLEALTHFDFFPSLNTDLQEIIESRFNPDFWPISVE
ncbi:MAG: DNA/RNA non-specific endonuclease [Bacteroidales bacterium]|nr:DNA/RNA non-specific endonuclease [Bacteroidales bacterium]MBN2817989.1 DNA/RNA non-specific endonuclease [Bacteroidales bacterium]